MAVSAKLFGKFFVSSFNGEVNLTSHALKCALFTSSATINQDTMQYFADIVSGEVANGNGYTTGGVLLGGVNITYDAATNTTKVDCIDPVWNSSTITADRAVFYDSTPSTNKPLIGWADLDGNKSSSNSTFTVQLDSNGLINTQVA
jgi:hypothetical protein